MNVWYATSRLHVIIYICFFRKCFKHMPCDAAKAHVFTREIPPPLLPIPSKNPRGAERNASDCQWHTRLTAQVDNAFIDSREVSGESPLPTACQPARGTGAMPALPRARELKLSGGLCHLACANIDAQLPEGALLHLLPP